MSYDGILTHKFYVTLKLTFVVLTLSSAHTDFQIGDDWNLFGQLQTHGKTVTIEAVEGTDNKDPSYVAVDSIMFISDDACETLPLEANVGGHQTSTANHPHECTDCTDGSGK